MDKKVYNKPSLKLEVFTPNEYITGCDYKWKYEGTEFEGDYLRQGTYNENEDYWTRQNQNTTNWVWHGDTEITQWPSPVSFLSNNGDLGEGSSGYYSGNMTNIGKKTADFGVKDDSVYKLVNPEDNVAYYSGELFEKSKNFS